MGIFNKFKLDFLPHLILEMPRKLSIENVGPTDSFIFNQADHELLIDSNFDKLLLRKVTFCCLLLLPLFIYLFYKPSDGYFGIGVFILGMIVSLVLFIYSFTAPDKSIIFDRLNGLITYPGFMWEKSFTIPFKDAKVYIGGYQTTEGVVTGRILNIMINKRRHSTIANFEPENFWSMYVWYMDKNRPLPPGTAFDPYRELDYQRRKAEGFPKPLYESSIFIPEYRQE